MKVTNLKNNQRLIEPRPAMNKEEIRIQVQKQEVVEEAKMMIKKEKDTKN